jgi:hypothetical protein
LLDGLPERGTKLAAGTKKCCQKAKKDETERSADRTQASAHPRRRIRVGDAAPVKQDRKESRRQHSQANRGAQRNDHQDGGNDSGAGRGRQCLRPIDGRGGKDGTGRRRIAERAFRNCDCLVRRSAAHANLRRAALRTEGNAILDRRCASITGMFHGVSRYRRAAERGKNGEPSADRSQIVSFPWVWTYTKVNSEPLSAGLMATMR